MENSPTPYQRQRRTARYAASPAPQPLPPEETAQPVTVPVQSSQPRVPAAPPPVYQPSGYPQHRTAYPQQQPQGMTPVHPMPPAGNRTPRALQQRPASFSDWGTPVQQSAVRTAHPTPVPRPSASSAAPARPIAEGSRRQRPEAPAQQRPVQKRKTPSWLLTLLSLMLIGVMALVALDFLMQAYLKTAADEKQAAYHAVLNNYHVTEQADGTLRVTWQDIIERYAEAYNLNPAFVTAIIRNESSFRTNAESSVGARGLMQMMPDTAEWVAGKLNDPYDFDRLYEAETSIRYGCWYLNYLSELFRGNTVLVAAAYHAGQGEVWGWLGNPSVSPDGVTVPIDNIPISNTKTYAGRVTQAYGIYQTLLYPHSSAGAPSGALSDDGAAAGLLAAADR